MVKYIKKAKSTSENKGDLFRLYFDFGEDNLVLYFKNEMDMENAYQAILKCALYGNPGVDIRELEA